MVFESSVIHVSCRNVVGWESFLGPPEHGRLLPFLASGRTNDSPDFPSPLRVHATRSVRRVCPAYDAWSCYIHLLFDADSSFLSLSFVAICSETHQKESRIERSASGGNSGRCSLQDIQDWCQDASGKHKSRVWETTEQQDTTSIGAIETGRLSLANCWKRGR